jgi:hypothetical protein
LCRSFFFVNFTAEALAGEHGISVNTATTDLHATEESPEKNTLFGGKMGGHPLENRCGAKQIFFYRAVCCVAQSPGPLLSLVSTAIGGALASLIFFGVQRFFISQRTKPRKLNTYLCCPETNRGQKDEARGELMHHHGEPVTERSVLLSIGVEHAVWKWTKVPTGNGSGASVIYGPYTNDFHRPGFYSVTFYILGEGFPNEKHLTGALNLNIFKLDAYRTEYLGSDERSQTVALTYVKAKDLARPGWQPYALNFQTDGGGAWEFRVLLDTNLKDLHVPDAMEKFPVANIYFDRIELRRERQSDAWASH